MRRCVLRVARVRSPHEPAGGRVTGACSRVGAARGAGAAVVIGPPEIASSAARGTRRSRPNTTTGSPSRPSVSRQTRASSYAAVRPIRRTRAASSTVKKSGWSAAVEGIGLPPCRVRTPIQSTQPGQKPRCSSRALAFSEGRAHRYQVAPRASDSKSPASNSPSDRLSARMRNKGRRWKAEAMQRSRWPTECTGQS